MSIEEAVGYAKTLFEELKFIEVFVYFCKGAPVAEPKEDAASEAGNEEKEVEYKTYISLDQL